MMGFNGGFGMMGGLGILAVLFWMVIFIDAVLLGFWLWNQLNKK